MLQTVQSLLTPSPKVAAAAAAAAVKLCPSMSPPHSCCNRDCCCCCRCCACWCCCGGWCWLWRCRLPPRPLLALCVPDAVAAATAAAAAAEVLSMPFVWNTCVYVCVSTGVFGKEVISLMLPAIVVFCFPVLGPSQQSTSLSITPPDR